MYLLYVKEICLILFFSYTGIQFTSTLPASDSKDVVIQNVYTEMDISANAVDILHKITFVAVKNQLQSFIFNVDPTVVHNVAYIAAKTIHNRKVQTLGVNEIGHGVWEIVLNYPVLPDEGKTISVTLSCTNLLKPYPTQVRQKEKHLAVYSGPVSLYSWYLILNYNSVVKIGDGALEDIVTSLSYELTKDSINFKSNNSMPIEPYSVLHAKIHYEHRKPLLTVKYLQRTIEISHWGYIIVKNYVQLENCGAKLRGSFNRGVGTPVNYPSVVNNIRTDLPVYSEDIVFYDDIGVISNYMLRNVPSGVAISILPGRFPLMGGWKGEFTMKYLLPSYPYIFKHQYGNNYKLQMLIVDDIYENMVVDKAVIKVIMPEGAYDYSLETPYKVGLENETTHYSYLDIIGRPVMVFNKKNLVKHHIDDFILNYRFSISALLFKAFSIISLIEIIFCVVIVFCRCDFTITENEEHGSNLSVLLPNVVGQNKPLAKEKSKKKKNK